MSLSNLNNDVTTRLFKMLSINDQNDLNEIKSNYSTFSKLNQIAEQINFLQCQAKEIINNHNANNILANISCSIKKVPGNIYYHYIINNSEILSIIDPNEWNSYDKYIGKYLYNYDHLFYKID